VQALVETGRQYAVYLHAPVGTGRFAARWTGRLDPPTTGTYRLTTVSDDGIRLWLDGKLLIENWTDHAATEDHATVDLVGGRPADLKVDYYQGGGGATARLKWTRPDGVTEVVPADRLLLPDGSGRGIRAEYFEGRTFDEPQAARVEAAIDFEWPPLPRPIAREATGGPAAIALDLPAGRYRAEWIDPKTGVVTRSEDLQHAGGRRSLSSPAFDEDVALSVRAGR
jgi:PA14 domain